MRTLAILFSLKTMESLRNGGGGLGKVIFSQVCVIPVVHRGGSVGVTACITGYMTSWICIWGELCFQGRWADTSPRCMGYYGIRSTSGRYASYWNAFLFSMRTESLAPSQSCGSVDSDAWCKQTLRLKRRDALQN